MSQLHLANCLLCLLVGVAAAEVARFSPMFLCENHVRKVDESEAIRACKIPLLAFKRKLIAFSLELCEFYGDRV
jgi:hypothetical protein